jgi:hypothetical protein
MGRVSQHSRQVRGNHLCICVLGRGVEGRGLCRQQHASKGSTRRSSSSWLCS